jgi:hypothetical protein
MGGVKSSAVGCILWVAAIFITLIIVVIGLANPAIIRTQPLWYVITDIVASMVMVIGVLLVSVGAMKLGKYYNNALLIVTGIMGLVAGIIGLVSTILGLAGIFADALAGVAGIMGLAMWVLTGVFLVLLGISFVVLRAEIGYGGLSMGTGIMLLIAGAMACFTWIHGVVLLVDGLITIPALVCTAYLFLKVTGIPEAEVKKAKKLAVCPAEAKKLVVRPAEEKKRMKPEEVEAEVYKYIKRRPGEIDITDCAKKLGVSEKEVEKAIKSLVKKGKLEMG